MNIIKQFPHCDPRILHKPGQCDVCDKHPEWQELRESWQIAFTGEKLVDVAPDARERGAVLPCPADFVRGDSHRAWGGNRPTVSAPPTVEVVECWFCNTYIVKTLMCPRERAPESGDFECIDREACVLRAYAKEIE